MAQLIVRVYTKGVAAPVRFEVEQSLQRECLDCYFVGFESYFLLEETILTCPNCGSRRCPEVN